jgi:hypothetical protein
VAASGGGNADLVELSRPPPGWGQCISDEMKDDRIHVIAGVIWPVR